ncbi:MAG: glycosyltransferase family 2 protein [Hyphomicrobiaceae bacterium]
MVSLAMPVFNGEKYIGSAIESLLSQDHENFELIITDNASDDATPAICRSYAERDARIRYIANPRNLGAAPNYNRGFEHARGTYLKWCAHDDLISPNYLSACVAALEADPGATLAFGRTQCIDDRGALIAGEDADEMGAVDSDRPSRRFYEAMARGGTCFPIFGVFRMEALRRSTLHRSYYGSDRALIAEVALLGRCLLVESAVFYNREHPKRSIRMTDHAQRSQWQDTSSKRSASMEHVRLLAHLAEIANRHPTVVRREKALLQVARLAMTPRGLARIGLDLTRYVSPSAGSFLRRAFVGPPGQATPGAGNQTPHRT